MYERARCSFRPHPPPPQYPDDRTGRTFHFLTYVAIFQLKTQKNFLVKKLPKVLQNYIIIFFWKTEKWKSEQYLCVFGRYCFFKYSTNRYWETTFKITREERERKKNSLLLAETEFQFKMQTVFLQKVTHSSVNFKQKTYLNSNRIDFLKVILFLSAVLL